MDQPSKPQINPFLKIALDLGPLVLFFIANSRLGIFGATAVFMIATVLALAIGYLLTRHIPIMPLVSAIIVLVFGSLTLYLQDDTFIKIKPTIIYVMFGAILLGGQIMGKPLLATVFDQVFHLNSEGWRKLTIRWAVFFFALAVLNEIVWRTQSTDLWVKFKTFGFLPLTLLFALAQAPLIMRYESKEDPANDAF